jgi:hypothetical protein
MPSSGVSEVYSLKKKKKKDLGGGVEWVGRGEALKALVEQV